MASRQPTYSGSAQTKEFDIDLLAADIHWAGDPETVRAVVSVDANSTLRVEISAANEFDWQLNARIVDGSLDIARIFCEGDSVHDDDVPAWVERVAGVIGERLAEGR